MVGQSAQVIVTPIDGWGYSEEIDGRLASPFEVSITEAGVDVGDGVLGWRGTVPSDGSKYSGMQIQMTPRHTDWTGYVVIWVFDKNETVFSGMAETAGLECNWK